ncbi:MAG: RNA polymerase sigma factor [Anaerovoracaceae bacterium]
MKRHRDEEFFKKNIAALYGDVYRFARAMTDDALSAQDITQNTMETAWRNLHKLRSRRQIRSWVFHIAKEETDKCLSGKRRADLSFEEVEAELNPELLIEESADILKTLLEREQSDQIIAALNLLSPRYQSVVKLWAMGSLSQREIAKVMGMNRSTTRICLRRGLKAFRKAYASLNYESAESVKPQVQKREIRRKDEEQKAEEQPEIPC